VNRIEFPPYGIVPDHAVSRGVDDGDGIAVELCDVQPVQVRMNGDAVRQVRDRQVRDNRQTRRVDDDDPVDKIGCIRPALVRVHGDVLEPRTDRHISSFNVGVGVDLVEVRSRCAV